MNRQVTRRTALRAMGAALAVPFAFRQFATAAPSETLLHASFGGDGMAWADIGSLTSHKNLKLVAVAEVDERRLAKVKEAFPDVRTYSDWRVLLDKEKDLDSVNVSTPDHMHAPIAMSAMNRGLHVYGQKPLTQTIHEARQLTLKAAGGKLTTQMGIQIHSHPVHRTVVEIIKGGAIGKVKEAHSWSGKHWGDTNPRPDKEDEVPPELAWNLWLGVASERPFIRGHYHPGEWRKRLDFGTGTFGDMGCHILDPVFASLELTFPRAAHSTGGSPNEHNWGLNARVKYTFPETARVVDGFTLTWYDGDLRPPESVRQLVGGTVSDQGSIYIGTEGVLYSPYIAAPVLLPSEKFADYEMPNPGGNNHYHQFVDACRGEGETSAPFSFSGPLTEMVLMGCLATRFPEQTLEWDAEQMRVTNVKEANQFVKREYRKGWEVKGL